LPAQTSMREGSNGPALACQRHSGVVQHQRVGAEKHAVIAGAVLHDAHAGQPVQLRERRVALIDQIVGRLTCRALHVADALIQLGHLARECVDALDEVADFDIHAILQAGQIAALGVHRVRQPLGGGEDALAHGRRSRIIGESLPGSKEILQRGGEPCGTIAQDRVDLRQRLRAFVHIGALAIHLEKLAFEEGVVTLSHRLDARPLADESAAGEPREVIDEHRLLAAIARGIDIGDVVTRRRQRQVRVLQGRDTDRHRAHDCPFSSGGAGSAPGRQTLPRCAYAES
jgi:hypothetical protein